MINEPKVVIEYLVNYDIEVTGTIDESISNPTNLTGDDSPIGKKGFHLNGGYYDETKGEDVGTLMNGTYTFYDANKMYNGLVGTAMSNANYTFDTDQYLTVSVTQPNTYIKSLFIYFDNVAGEIATKLSFSNPVPTDATNVNPATIYRNNKYIFMHSFGEDSTLTSVRVNFLEWSKRNATVKVLKIKTGYTAVYDPFTIRDIYYTRDKFSDTENLKFGVTIQEATFQINDYDGMIMDLYNSDLIFKNVQVNLYIDNVLEGSYIIDSKESNNTIDYWSFDCKDFAGIRMSDTLPALNIDVDSDNLPIPKPLTYFIDYAIGGIVNVIYESDELRNELSTTMVNVPFIRSGSTRENVLTMVCQIALLRMYSDKQGNLRIERGL